MEMNMNEINQQLDKFNQELDKFNQMIAIKKKELHEYSKEAITNIYSKVFKEYPEIEKIRWRQWVPAFNDGEPCVFKTGDLEIFLIGDESKEEGTEFFSKKDYNEAKEILDDWKKYKEDPETIINKYVEKAKSETIYHNPNLPSEQYLPYSFRSSYRNPQTDFDEIRLYFDIYGEERTQELYEMSNTLQRFHSKLDDNVLESLFDYNVEITIKRNKDGSISTEVEEYDCGY